MTKIAGSGSISQRQRSADPDPPQNVMDPQHCSPLLCLFHFPLLFSASFTSLSSSLPLLSLSSPSASFTSLSSSLPLSPPSPLLFSSLHLSLPSPLLCLFHTTLPFSASFASSPLWCLFHLHLLFSASFPSLTSFMPLSPPFLLLWLFHHHLLFSASFSSFSYLPLSSPSPLCLFHLRLLFSASFTSVSSSLSLSPPSPLLCLFHLLSSSLPLSPPLSSSLSLSPLSSIFLLQSSLISFFLNPIPPPPPKLPLHHSAFTCPSVPCPLPISI